VLLNGGKVAGILLESAGDGRGGFPIWSSVSA
jgi:biotin-(acetyl-CoA carboxylase) ligase